MPGHRWPAHLTVCIAEKVELRTLRDLTVIASTQLPEGFEELGSAAHAPRLVVRCKQVIRVFELIADRAKETR